MKPETLSQMVYRELRADIAEGRIAPNALLSERDLADRFRVSRTPLRSALLQLESEGAIERLTNGVLLVRAVTIEKLLEILHLRQILESAAAGRAALHGVTPDLAAAREASMQFINGPSDFDSFWASDDHFHMSVAAAAGLVLLRRILVEQRAIVKRSTVIRAYRYYHQRAREHIAVINAIEARNPDAARAAMSQHFDQMRARLLGTLPAL